MTEGQQTADIDNQLELLKFAAQVHSPIKNNVTPDYTLATLDTKDKKAIVEMTSNAYYAERLITNIINRANAKRITGQITNKEGQPYWDYHEHCWDYRKLKKEEEEEIKKQAKKAYDLIITRVYLTLIMNRNIDKNWLVSVLAGLKEQLEQQEPTEEPKKEGVFKKLLRPEKKKDEKE